MTPATRWARLNTGLAIGGLIVLAQILAGGPSIW